MPLPAALPWTPTEAQKRVYATFNRERWRPLMRGIGSPLGVFELWSPAHETLHAAGHAPPLVLTHENGLTFP